MRGSPGAAAQCPGVVPTQSAEIKGGGPDAVVPRRGQDTTAPRHIGRDRGGTFAPLTCMALPFNLQHNTVMRQNNTYSGRNYSWNISAIPYVFLYRLKFYNLFTDAPPSSSRTHFYWEIAMRKFNFRIGTKLGIAAGLGVLLVGGMLINQQVGNALIEKYALYTSLNFTYKGITQDVTIATQRAYRATTEIER